MLPREHAKEQALGNQKVSELEDMKGRPMGVALANETVFSTDKETVTPLGKRWVPFGIENPCILHSTYLRYYKALRQLYTVPWDLHILQPMRNSVGEHSHDCCNNMRWGEEIHPRADRIGR